jgi:hypothetical protein
MGTLPPWLWMMLGFLTIGLILWFLFGGDVVKRQLLKGMPDRVEFEGTKPEAFPSLDSAALKHYTDGLKALGFAFTVDYTFKTDIPLPECFARLMIHPTHQCFAEINQTFPPGKELVPMRCAFATLFEDDWGLSTTDRKPLRLNYVWRSPKSFWSCHPNLPLEELLKIHLQNRERMKQELSLTPLSHLTPEVLFTHEKKDNVDRKALLSSKSEWTILWEIRQFERNPKYEWFGG